MNYDNLVVAIQIIVVIVGAFISLALVVNAFFLKAILIEMHNIKLDIVKIFESIKFSAMSVLNLEARIVKLEKESKEIHDRMHSVEGSSAQALEYLKKLTNNNG